MTVGMDIRTDSHQVTRLAVVDTGRRRRWPEHEKLRIVEESLSGPRLASATARRHGISNQLLFAWRKAYREGRFGNGPPRAFVRALIAPEPPQTRSDPDCRRIEILSPNGWRVLVARDFATAALRRVLDALGER